MAIPSELQKLIKDALESVRCHPQHDLNLGYRQDKVGHRRRAFLASLAIRHVLPIWNKAFPNDDTPEKILAEADQVMNGAVNEEVAIKDIDQFWKYLWKLASSTKNMAVAVGLGAVQALATAIQDESFDPDNIDYDATDSQEFDNNDASFFAAVAYANGPTWEVVAEAESNPVKRQEFWEWWLAEAVPAAWEHFCNKQPDNTSPTQ